MSHISVAHLTLPKSQPGFGMAHLARPEKHKHPPISSSSHHLPLMLPVGLAFVVHQLIGTEFYNLR
ncbi:hypothetical protein QQP08_014225 [Theobroma cacao]|nr:hypothetical protein QQP08_014225 [Theobroma cacao]